MNVKEWAEKQFEVLSQQQKSIQESQTNNQILLYKIEGAKEVLQALYQAAKDEDNQSSGVQENQETQPKSASDS